MPASTQNIIRTSHLESTFNTCDKKSFELVYDTYAGALYGIISKTATSREAAEDVLSKTFITAWQQKQLFDGSKNSLFIWLANIARSIASAQIKLSKSESKAVSKNVYALNNANKKSNGSVTKAVDNVGTIESLPLKPSAFELIYYYGMNYESAAKELNIPVNEAKVSVQNEIKRLKTL